MGLYYLSFQRGPPNRVVSGEVISVAPTIINDLRDEVYQPDEGQVSLHIQLAWVRELHNKWKGIEIAADIVWQGPLSAYKTCQVIVPDAGRLRGCETIRLALWASGVSEEAFKPCKRMKKEEEGISGWIFNMGTSMPSDDGQIVIVPGLSSSIRVHSKSVDNMRLEKSTNMSRLLQVGYSQNIVEIVEESGYELDKHIWDASLHISQLMVQTLLQTVKRSTTPLSDLMKDALDGLRIVELGAGTGLVSIVLSAAFAQCRLAERAGATESQSAIRITATDLPSAIPLVERNINLNQRLLTNSNISIDCRPLDWSDESKLNDVQIILVSDCTYNPTYFAPLCSTIQRILVKGKQNAFCLLAKKHRHADEEGLWMEVNRCKLVPSLLTGVQAVQENKWGLWKLMLQ